ncbi:probable methyltransferase ICS2 [Magnolia sinica]|uniref:probable methyltransferase ICS2 n=1 Tax=Magnolia sinica TaxID=86752 RepID=UPI0026597F18|nr:probable methyltransferase ICS2 [Magnolia sinica]
MERQASVTMEVKEVLSMNGGDGENSFAQNSRFTRKIISITKPVLVKAIQDLFSNSFSSEILTVADLGCSCGPNTMSVVSTIISTVEKITHESNRPLPEFQVFLNDLPGNDFNSVFKGLPAFYREMMEGKEKNGLSCFIGGFPGSFHGRLFPKNSLHLVHSSYSVHWLSQVPQGLYSKEGLALNKGKMYISKTSPPCVWKAYLDQFQKDFYLFLKSRSYEVGPSGAMVLVLSGRSTDDPSSKESCYQWELLAEALSWMVSEGFVTEEKVDSFDVPYYTPSVEEVGEVVEKEGSFEIDQLEMFELGVGDEEEKDKWVNGEKVARNIRSFTEPLISYHFGQEITERLFQKFTEIVVKDLAKERTMATSIVVVMRKI